MKKILCFLLLLISFTAHGAEDPLAKGMKLYEKRHYREAESTLLAALPSVPAARQGSFQMALGITYLRSAEFHRQLYKTASAIYPGYLKRLAKGNGSKIAPLYAGEALLVAGKPQDAVTFLEPFIAAAEGKNRQLGEIALALSHIDLGDATGKDSLEAVNPLDPEVAAVLAAALAEVGGGGKDPQQLCDGAVATRKGKSMPMRIVKGCLSTYVQSGNIEKGLALLRQADLKACSVEETIGKNKVLFFYDLTLLKDIASLHEKAALSYLTKAAADPKLKETAQYYLAETHVKLGDLDDSARYAKAVAASQLPPQTKAMAAIFDAETKYKQGKKTEALALWEDVAQKNAGAPALLAETILSISRCRSDAPTVVQKAATAVERGDSKRYAQVSIALGRYYFGKRDYNRALTYMEAGRDKANKNKIEANDLLLLVDLADGYYRTKKYSEAQEIYFEMAKQFPEVRQIQDAIQGIYSREQKSAGDVRIF